MEPSQRNPLVGHVVRVSGKSAEKIRVDRAELVSVSSFTTSARDPTDAIASSMQRASESKSMNSPNSLRKRIARSSTSANIQWFLVWMRRACNDRQTLQDQPPKLPHHPPDMCIHCKDELGRTFLGSDVHSWGQSLFREPGCTKESEWFWAFFVTKWHAV